MALSKIESIEDIEDICAKYRHPADLLKHTVLICSGRNCVSGNCLAVRDTLLELLDAGDLNQSVAVMETECMGACDVGPIMVVNPGKTLYVQLRTTDLPQIVQSHLSEGNVVEEKTYSCVNSKIGSFALKDIDIFKAKANIALRYIDKIEHDALIDYILGRGYLAVAQTIQTMLPEELIRLIGNSGIHERGRAGFSNGVKWEVSVESPSNMKYLVCKVDQGDLGSFMDRVILEGNPHSLIEGMMLSGYATGAEKGYVYIDSEFPLAIKQLEEAIASARKLGILGQNILGSSLSFEIEVRTEINADTEDAAKQRLQYCFQRGCSGNLTTIDKVETYANLAAVVMAEI